MELFSERVTDNVKIKISIRLVGEMAKGDPHYPQFFNIVSRKGLEHLRLQLVGRNYFDANARVSLIFNKKCQLDNELFYYFLRWKFPSTDFNCGLGIRRLFVNMNATF